MSVDFHCIHMCRIVGSVRPGVTVLSESDRSPGVRSGQTAHKKEPPKATPRRSTAEARRQRGHGPRLTTSAATAPASAAAATGAKRGGVRSSGRNVDPGRDGTSPSSLLAGLDRSAAVPRPTGAGSAGPGVVHEL